MSEIMRGATVDRSVKDLDDLPQLPGRDEAWVKTCIQMIITSLETHEAIQVAQEGNMFRFLSEEEVASILATRQ